MLILNTIGFLKNRKYSLNIKRGYRDVRRKWLECANNIELYSIYWDFNNVIINEFNSLTWNLYVRTNLNGVMELLIMES